MRLTVQCLIGPVLSRTLVVVFSSRYELFPKDRFLTMFGPIELFSYGTNRPYNFYCIRCCEHCSLLTFPDEIKKNNNPNVKKILSFIVENLLLIFY